MQHCSLVMGSLATNESIVTTERVWREPPPQRPGTAECARVTATRWQADGDRVSEHTATTASDCHVAKLVVRGIDIRLTVAGRIVQDGILPAGSIHVTDPGMPVRCLFRGPCDVLHLHIPQALMADLGQHLPGGAPATLRHRSAPSHLSAIEPLARALLDAERLDGLLGPIYADCIGVAIVSRLLASNRADRRGADGRGSGLVPWRLRRTLDFVEAHLERPLGLTDMAAAAGLTRMHFAAQFRRSTGFPPHQYLLRRRIERAQYMLASRAIPLVDVALSVGFQSQSHFTSVFKRLIGETPHVWRLAQGNRTPSGMLDMTVAGRPRGQEICVKRSSFSAIGSGAIRAL
jgi:AraC family transcriptional regulator